MTPEALQARLETLPSAPGCYLFRNKKGEVVYVGKARSLRQRVRQYFQPNSSDYRYFVPLLDRVLEDIETVVTATEKEAVILESSLIKEHHPKYNVRLKDDKDYLSIRLDRRAGWPRLQVVRRPRVDGAEYFGPYPNATEARRAMHLVNRHFQLRTCTDQEFGARTRPCLEHQIKRCLGPCVLPVDHAAYSAQMEFVEMFLKGKSTELATRLEGEMQSAARATDFERAARLRDQLTAIRRVQETQRVAEVSDIDRDVFGMYREGDSVVVTMLLVREGFVRDSQSSTFGRVELPDDELISSVITSRYMSEAATIPDEVVLPCEPEGVDGIREWLSDHKGKAVKIAVPHRGSRSGLLSLATENAMHAFREKGLAAAHAGAQSDALARALGLDEPPSTIECVDISHHGGDDTVGAVIRLLDGLPDKRCYRSFHVRSVATGDDYSAMYEVLSRRFKRAIAGEEGWELPDLFVVDGGRGQLGVVTAVLQDLGATGISVCGIAKERENALGEQLVDRVYSPGRKNPVTMRENGPALVLLARARDEAHRFANKIREDLHKKKRLRSELDELPGVGAQTRVALLKAFGSVSKVSEATITEMAAVAGVGEGRARTVYEHFHPGVSQLPERED